LPMFYVHLPPDRHRDRLYGCAISIAPGKPAGEDMREFEIALALNEEPPQESYQALKDEIENRIGLSQAVTISEMRKKFSEQKEMVELAELLWPRLRAYYGDMLPYGRLYDQVFGILRFACSFNTIGGRQQEYIMLSNLLARLGEKARVNPSIGLRSFRLLPHYSDFGSGKWREFTTFSHNMKAIEEFGKSRLTEKVTVAGHTYNVLGHKFQAPQTNDKWTKLVSGLSSPTQRVLTDIKEDLNRNFMRPLVLLTPLYNLVLGFPFHKVTGADFYAAEARAIYPKIHAAFLQQAFGQEDSIPVDMWIGTFYRELLQIEDSRIPTLCKGLGKYERLVWLAAKLRKTNQPEFDDILFCIKTGVMRSEERTTGSIVPRTANPVSCALCAWRPKCPRYRSLGNEEVAVGDEKPTAKLAVSKYVRRGLVSGNTGPREVYVKARNRWKKVDDMSAYAATPTSTPLQPGVFSFDTVSHWVRKNNMT